MMQIEPMPDSDGYRCWLSPSEQDQLVEYFSEEPKKRLAVELMLDGLRSEEVPRAALMGDLLKSDVNDVEAVIDSLIDDGIFYDGDDGSKVGMSTEVRNFIRGGDA